LTKTAAERFQYARAFKWGWHHQNAPTSCNYCIIELHIKQAFCRYI